MHKRKRIILTAVYCLLAVSFGVVILQNAATLKDSVDILQTANAWWVLASVLVLVVGFGLAALSYRFLAFSRLKFKEQMLIELASASVNKLMPSGLGSLGVHGVYLHNRKHTFEQVTAVVSVNNLTGMVVHLLLLATVLTTQGQVHFHLGWQKIQGWVSLGMCLLVILLALMWLFRARLRTFFHNFLRSLRHYRTHPLSLLYAGMALALLTCANVLILALVAQAFAVDINLPTLFIVYSLGVFLGAAVPTPGGVGGAELGLAAGLIMYGLDSPTAIALALTFRVVTFWLPIVPGLVAFAVCTHRRLL